MKTILLIIFLLGTSLFKIDFNADRTVKKKLYAFKYVNGYFRKDGTYVRGYFRDTSNDGYEYNNANYWGING